jgi:hypothetical protein
LQDALGGVGARRPREGAQIRRVFRRDHEDVLRCLGIEVAERDDVRVAEDFVCGELAADDLTKEAGWIGAHFLKLIVSK